ncbi:MAG: Asp23/Gls24 family envelope stress response protein, partial [Clostridia bacterium]|nr:Asp23/Gls24 family envelope stress response protein [Clostridia bacterium]
MEENNINENLNNENIINVDVQATEKAPEEISLGNNNAIKIADDVVAVIAGVAVSEIPGVANMAGGFAGGISEVLSGKKNLAKGIKVDINEKE